jgi:membrane protein DedA with SNARE-associated domain
MDLENIRLLLEQWGYLIIVGWTFLEGETVVLVAGFLASQQILDLNPWLIVPCAFIGSFCSDQLMFSLGRYKGEAVLRRFPRLAKNTDKARRLMLKYENALIIGFRFVYGVRNVTPVLLGISGVRHKKFFVLNMLGATVWAFCFSFGGFYFGELINHFAAEHPYLKYVILGGFVLLVVSAVCLARLRLRIQNRHLTRQALNAARLNPPDVADRAQELSRAGDPPHSGEQHPR